MAEFCLDCWNRINKTKDGKTKYVLSKDLDFCEGCGKWKHVVITERNFYDEYRFLYFILLYKNFSWIIYFLWKLIQLVYLSLKHKPQKDK